MREYENELLKNNMSIIAGVDEAGRGPLVGPVVAACVVLPNNYVNDEINDSKKLSEKKRDTLFNVILDNALGVGIGIVSAKRIDEINIYEATKEAMYSAIDECYSKIHIEHVLIDAMKLNELKMPFTSIIKGDAKSISIAAASIIAKVTRDKLLYELDEIYPMYNFKKNKGYGTKEHLEALKNFGKINEHRESYRPVRETDKINV